VHLYATLKNLFRGKSAESEPKRSRWFRRRCDPGRALAQTNLEVHDRNRGEQLLESEEEVVEFDNCKFIFKRFAVLS
jgi:hypothetical protein